WISAPPQCCLSWERFACPSHCTELRSGFPERLSYRHRQSLQRGNNLSTLPGVRQRNEQIGHRSCKLAGAARAAFVLPLAPFSSSLRLDEGSSMIWISVPLTFLAVSR